MLSVHPQAYHICSKSLKPSDLATLQYLAIFAVFRLHKRLLCLDFAHCHAGMGQDELQAVAQSMSQLLLQHKQCEWLMKSGQPVKAQALALSALHLADSLPAPVQALSPNHIWRMRLNEVLLRACVACGINWNLALQTAQKLQPVYEIVYPKVMLCHTQALVNHTYQCCPQLLQHCVLMSSSRDSRTTTPYVHA